MPPPQQTVDAVMGVYNASLAAVVGYLEPKPFNRRIVLAAVTGPLNSTLTIYRGYIPTVNNSLSTVFPADVRTYDSLGNEAPMVIFAGEAAVFVWTGASVTASSTATATVRSNWGG